MTFLTPALLKDPDVLSRPAAYIRWDVRSTDGKPHKAALYFDAVTACGGSALATGAVGAVSSRRQSRASHGFRGAAGAPEARR
ncbi:MAG: DUF5127 domain-containing protein [Bryobacterales bacterium]|nr:DUF5127 domain-containing protein [Bryobacterales bacterium]